MSTDFISNFINPNKGIIIRICRAYTSTNEDFEDYYQEVCLQLWKSRENFNEKSIWSTWMYKVTLNVCLFLSRKESKHSFVSFDSFSNEITNTEEKISSEDSINELYEAIKQLSEIDRAVIILYLEEKTYQEIAEITGTNQNYIGVRINRIKQRLKIILNEKVD